MDEEEIKYLDNIPRDLEKCFDYLTPGEMDSSLLDLLDGSNKKKDFKLPEIVSNVSITSSINDKFSVSEIDLNATKMDTTACHKETDHASNNDERENREFEPNAPFASMNNNIKGNVNKGLVFIKEIKSVNKSTASNSSNEVLTTKDSGISLDDEEEIVFDQVHEDSPVRSFTDIVLPESDSKVLLDKSNTIEIVPDNIDEATANSDIVDMPLRRLSNNDKEETIFNYIGQTQQTSIKSPPDSDESFATAENNIDKNADKHCYVRAVATDKSVKEDETPNLNSLDYLTRSKSIAELSAVRTSKPNSLAEDAKLVKFSVPSKSVNIMQSNAQFLNKSRNFINFITEKSTNIMEKTLLPQNLAAKCDTVFRLTVNTPTRYKKFIETTASSSDSVDNDLTLNSNGESIQNCETNNQIPDNVTKLDSQNTDTIHLYNGVQQDKSVSANYGTQEDSTKKERELFLKCSVNESKSNNPTTEKGQETELTSTNATTDINSEIGGPIFRYESPNIMEKEKVSSLNFDGPKEDRNVDNSSTTSDPDSSNKILIATLEKSSEILCRDSDSSNDESTINIRINKEDSTKENELDDALAIYGNESNAGISPSSRTVSIQGSNRPEKNFEHDVSKSPGNQLIDLELLAHPAYITLLRDYSNLRDESAKLSKAMVKVEMENQRLAAENNTGLEKTIEELRHDLKQANANQELLNKEYLLANKEKESMVMKYAISEKQLIDTQRAREYAERKIHEVLKEQELLHTKLKQVQGERTRICNILDGKCHELTDAQREVERLKEESSMREVKLKWTQNKLKTELELYKENQQKLDKAMLRISEMKEECEQVRKESQETIRKFQQSEENRIVTLDHQLKEQQARLILERHVTEDKELSRLQLQKEVETLKQRQHALIEENNTLSLKVQNLEKERLNYENNLSNLKIIADQRQKEILDLVGKVSQLETIKLQLKHKEQLLSSNEAEVERLRQSNAELQSDMEWCREREAHMLDFTQKLTDKNVRLQSEFTSIEAKNEQLELEQGPLHEQIKELSTKAKALEISLASEKSKRTEECELLARHVAEQTQLARSLSQKLEDSQGENAVLRRKRQISVKEMTKELQQCKKRLDAFESGSPSNSLDRTSRTGSSSSLSTGETLNGAVSDNNNSGDILQSVEPDRQTLIDRIVKLQRIRVRQVEKLDFLEEHTRTLVNELQKKTKIIKNYILHENPDAMGSNERDKNKAELARHGGIMASVYNQRVSDDNMTLELSLEINQKLQAVLEDTLLKNITLKDSIDTLGGEIARLTMQNNRRP